jgi:hypothetical protein
VNETDEKRIAARQKRLGIWCGLGIVLAVILSVVISRSALGPAMSADQRRVVFMDILLRPYFLIPYLLLAGYGLVESWRARADWKIDRIPLYVFLMCLVSLVQFAVNLVRLRGY